MTLMMRKRVEAGTGPAVGETGRERAASLAQRYGSLVVLVLAVVVASILFDSFRTADNFRNIALDRSFIAVVALGMTFVIITGGIDLSVGSVYALGGVVAAGVSPHGSLLAILAALAVGGGVGLVNGVVVEKGGLPPFIVTLATLLFARGLLLYITDEGATTYRIDSSSFLAHVGQGDVWGIGYPVFIAVVLFLLGGLLLQRTRYGMAVFAVGGSEDAARLMGLPVARVKILTYVLSGVLASLGGVMDAAQSLSGVTIVGVGLELTAISAVVIGGALLTGGAGSVGGTLTGVLLLGVILNVINQIGTLTGSYQQVVNGAFLVVVVVGQTFLSRRQRL